VCYPDGWPRGFNGEETGVPTSPVRIGTVIIGYATLALGGCASTGSGQQAVWATPGHPPGASASAKPSAVAATAEPDKAAMQKKATAAAIAPGGLAAIGGASSPKRDEPRLYLTTDVCGQRIKADSDIHLSHSRTWAGDGLYVQNTTQVYATTTGAAAVAQVRTAAESCPRYPSVDGQRTTLGPVDLPQYPNTEARYGFCHHTTPAKGPEYFACSAYLAKGSVLSSIMVVRGPTRQTATSGLLTVGSVAAGALTGAT
jgi:hypothetical protein